MKKLLLNKFLWSEKLEDSGIDGKVYDISKRAESRDFAKEISSKSALEGKNILESNIKTDLTSVERKSSIDFLNKNIKKTGYWGSKEEYDKIANEYKAELKNGPVNPEIVVKWKLEKVFGNIMHDEEIANTYNNILGNNEITKEQNQLLFLIGLFQILSNDYQQSSSRYKKVNQNGDYIDGTIDYGLVDLKAGPVFFETLANFGTSGKLKELSTTVKPTVDPVKPTVDPVKPTVETPIDQKINKTQEAYNVIVMADHIGELLTELKSKPIKGKKDIEAFQKGIDEISNTIDTLKQDLDYTGLDKFIKDISNSFKKLGKGDKFFDGVKPSSTGYILNISNRKLEKNDAKVMSSAMKNFNKKYELKQLELKSNQNTVDLSYESDSNKLLGEYNNKIDTLSKNQVSITEKQSKIVELSGRYQTILSEIESSNIKLKELNTNSTIQNASEKTKLEDDIKRLNKEKNENLTSRVKLNNEIAILKENLPTQEDISSTRSSYVENIDADIKNIENIAGNKIDELSDIETNREDMISRVKENKEGNKKEFENDLKNISDDISKLIESGDMTGLEEKQKSRTKTIENYNKNLSQLNTLENTTYLSNINKFEIKNSVINAKKGKIDEVRNSLSSQKKIANETKTSLENNLNGLTSLQDKIGKIGTDSWNIEDQSPFNIDQEIKNIRELIQQKDKDIEEINKQLAPLDTQSKDMQQESKDISTYISILDLQQRQDILQQEMDVYKIIGSDNNPYSGLIPDTKKQVEDIKEQIKKIDTDIASKNIEIGQAASTEDKQKIQQEIDDLNAQKKGSENAKNIFDIDLKKYESIYNSLSTEKASIDSKIKEIDPDGSKTNKIPEELKSITPQTVGMISADKNQYEDMA